MRAGRRGVLVVLLVALVLAAPACGKKGPPRLPPQEAGSSVAVALATSQPGAVEIGSH